MKLPVSAKVNKVIPKTQFYNRVYVTKKLRDDFISKIQKITWKYKIAEDTININKTENVEEIQVFYIELKEKVTSKNVLQTIDKLIPYPILFVISFEDEIQYAISLKENGIVKGYYFSEWNEKIDFVFTGVDLEKVYQKIIKKFIKKTETEGRDFGDIIETDDKVNTLEKEISRLECKIKNEKQFNKKVVLNKELNKKRKDLHNLKNK